MAQVDSETITATPADAAGALYIPTDISPQEVFQAIGRLRKDAQDEIERLLSFLDAIEDPELEDGGDAEPSFGASEPLHPVLHRRLPADQTRWAQGDRTDLEQEHDGREPHGDNEPSLCGLSVSMGNDQDLECDNNADAEPTLGSFDRMVDQEKSWSQRAVCVQDGEVDASIADGPRQAAGSLSHAR